MRELDDTDLEILRLLGENARRPFSDIADEIGLSAPAVSDRVTRLQDIGIIKRFTLDVDRTQLQAGIPIFVQITLPSEHLELLKNRVTDTDAIEHVFVTANGDLWFYARAERTGIRDWVSSLLEEIPNAEYSVTLMDTVEWQPSVEGTEFALTCVECNNTVDSEGESARIDGQIYHFCCSSCKTRFTERYTRLEREA